MSTVRSENLSYIYYIYIIIYVYTYTYTHTHTHTHKQNRKSFSGLRHLGSDGKINIECYCIGVFVRQEKFSQTFFKSHHNQFPLTHIHIIKALKFEIPHCCHLEGLCGCITCMIMISINTHSHTPLLDLPAAPVCAHTLFWKPHTFRELDGVRVKKRQREMRWNVTGWLFL